MIVSVALFVLGSGVAGGANTPGMFIAGRLVQGLGACAVGSLIGPVIGGAIVSRTTWRLGLLYQLTCVRSDSGNHAAFPTPITEEMA